MKETSDNKRLPPTDVPGDASDNESPSSTACPRNNRTTQGGIGPKFQEDKVGGGGTDNHVADLDVIDERRIEPETGRLFTFNEFAEAFSGQYSSDEIRAYWRDACARVADKVQ